jgi:hypothetical protein
MGGFGQNTDSFFENGAEFPKNDDQLKHIFGKRPGHVPDTKANRQNIMLVPISSVSGTFIEIIMRMNKHGLKC